MCNELSFIMYLGKLFTSVFAEPLPRFPAQPGHGQWVRAGAGADKREIVLHCGQFSVGAKPGHGATGSPGLIEDNSLYWKYYNFHLHMINN